MRHRLGFAFALIFLAAMTARTSAAEPVPLPSFRDCAECPDMVVLPAGSFVRGREVGRAQERPEAVVQISRPFAIARYETSFAEYDPCATAGACPPVDFDRGWGRGDRPVIYVDVAAAEAYAAWLSDRTGRPYRLPTEDEWEYAAQGGTGDKDGGAGRANCQTCFDGWNHATFPVGSFPANGFGLFDMLGNVIEWTAGCWRADHDQASPPDCTQRAWRGGSWYFNADVARATQRFPARPTHRGYDVGFRLVAEP